MQNIKLVLIKFKIRRLLRFLSHAEMLRVFQRCCIRAGIEVLHSQGFNPRPKLSLPLPRSVGIETDDDLLCLKIETAEPSFESESFKTKLSKQLPNGCELLSVTLSEAKAPVQPCAATYVLPVQQKYIDEKLRSRITHLLASETLNLQRRVGTKTPKVKNLDVRGFLQSIELQDTTVVVECKISGAGSIRLDEILGLLQLDTEKLAAPIRRTNVKWQNN